MGTWTNINDGEGGESVRTKLNNAFGYLFGWIADPPPEEDQSRWEDDNGDITPKDEKGIVVSSIDAGEGEFGEIEAADGFKVDGDGKIFFDKLKEATSLPLLVDTDGRVRTVATVDTYSVTITFQRPVAPTDITGEVWLHKPGFPPISSEISSNQAGFEAENGTYSYMAFLDGFLNMRGSITVSGADVTLTLNVESEFGVDPEDTVEGRGGVYINEGSESNLDIERPTAVVDRDANYDLQLGVAASNKSAEMGARKAETGGALTLQAEGGFVMDGDTGDVLTTTTKGAWVKVKSIDVDGTYKWVVIMDSGDWTLASE